MSGNGFYVPLITPFNEAGQINFKQLGEAAKHVMKSGAEGIYAVGSSAECFSMTVDERKMCLETIANAVGGERIIAHIGHISTDIAEGLARHAEEVGVKAVASVPPFYFRFSAEQIKGYFDDIAAAVNIPLMIYNIPLAGALSLEQLADIMKNPSIYAIKFTDTNYYVLERLKVLTGKPIYSGADECFISALAAGADGAIGTTFNFMLDKYIAIKELFLAGKVKEALKVQTQANNITKILIETNNLAFSKYVMQLQGLDIDAFARRPFPPLTQTQKHAIEKVFKENL